MKSYIFILIALLTGLVVSCDDDQFVFFESYVKEEETLADNEEKNFFDIINLNYPGLEKVKDFYELEDYESAKKELLNYFRNRKNIVNPNIDLGNTSISTYNKNIADQALEYRFYIKDKYESLENGIEIYFSFKQDDKINWKFIPEKYKGDDEFVYQLHRHQWMIYQALAYNATKDEKYVKSWIEVYSDWLKTFPCPVGKVDKLKNPEWYGLQTAQRVVDQLDMVFYFINSENFTTEWLTVFFKALYESVESIRNNYYSSTNILITQVEAVFSAGILFPEFKKSTEWLSEGASKATEQVQKQFLDDGVHIEMTPGYHIEAVYASNKLYKMANMNGKINVFPTNYVQLLKNAARFVMDITYPDYSFDNFNDTGSSGWTKSVLLANFKRYMEMFPDDDEIRWMATEGKEGSKPTTNVQLYKTGGYYMLRSSWDKDAIMMVLKNNYNPQNLVHCHPDNGTFSLYYKGKNFLPDAGFYSYGGDDQSNNDRKTYMSTIMHNTLTKNCETIANGQMKGKFLKYENKDNIDVLITENQSYGDLNHRRSVFFVDKKFFVIVDEARGTTTKTVEVTFNINLLKNLNIKNDIVIDDDTKNYKYGAYTKTTDNVNMYFKTFVNSTNKYTTKWSTNYYSNKQGEKSGQRKWYRVSVGNEPNKVLRFITVIHPFTDEADRASLNIDAGFQEENSVMQSDAMSAWVSVKGQRYELSYTLD